MPLAQASAQERALSSRSSRYDEFGNSPEDSSYFSPQRLRERMEKMDNWIQGQNARLAAKLTGWKIDIKSHTQYYPEYEEAEVAEDEYIDEEALEIEEVAEVEEETIETEATTEEDVDSAE